MALVPTLVVVIGMAVFGLALLMAGLSGSRAVMHHNDDYRLRSAVESVAMLATDALWSGYLQENGGAASDISSFQVYLNDLDILDGDTVDLLASGLIELPAGAEGAEFTNVRIDGMTLARTDVDAEDTTQLALTVAASTNRGKGIVNPVLSRAIRVVYTVEPDDFEGFNYGILANNVNCVFCHTQVDSVDRFYNTLASNYGTFDRVRVGTLESLMLRHNMDGNSGMLNDYDTDAYVAGTMYVRGHATDHDGSPIGNWSALSFGNYEFDSSGQIVEDNWGNPMVGKFTPAGTPPDPLENLYLQYPTEYADMIDGDLPPTFPAPIPDDGGKDPATGLPTSAGKDNRIVDDEEFYAAALTAQGAITAGTISVTGSGDSIDSISELADAVFNGNLGGIQQTVSGSVVLTGTPDNPITIDGKVAIDGDLIINGYVKGDGTLVVRGNVYIPADLQYLDGTDSNGNRTFGIGTDGQPNKLALSAGGNILIGDYQRPATLQPDYTWSPPGAYDTVTGDTDGDWSFALAEMSLFNRGEWAKTQALLPGPGDDISDPGTWTASNLPANGGSYQGPGYVPRYYNFGPDDTIPIYNKGSLYYDTSTHTWRGDAEVPLTWDPDLVTLVDPGDTANPLLYDGSGNPTAVISSVAPDGGWIGMDAGIGLDLYKVAVEHFKSTRPAGTPLAIDGLLYTNNAIFGIVNRATPMKGQMRVNGGLIAADMGLLVPGFYNPGGAGSSLNVKNSTFAVGLQLNYDKRLKNKLNVKNPYKVKLKRTLWNPTANMADA